MVWSSPSSAQQTPLFLAALLYLFLPSTVVLLYFSAWPLVVAVLAGAAVFLAAPAPAAAPVAAPVVAAEPTGHIVKSPMVGTFYRSSAPGSDRKSVV